MATGGAYAVLNGTKMVEDVQEVCVGCLDLFDLKERSPRKLKCVHSVCSACCWTVTRLTWVIACPACQQETVLPGDKTQLPRNDELCKFITEAYDLVRATSISALFLYVGRNTNTT
jgi:hypothetical protein